MRRFLRDQKLFFIITQILPHCNGQNAPAGASGGRVVYYIVGAYWTMKFTEVSPWGSSPKV